MRYERSGKSLWYGTSDAPAPEGQLFVSPMDRAIGLTLTVGLHPISYRNSVEVRYRVNGGESSRVQAYLVRTDIGADTQYFVAHLPEFNIEDRVDYIAVATWRGGQVPAEAEAATFPSSFKVVGATGKKGAAAASANETGQSSAGGAGSTHAGTSSPGTALAPGAAAEEGPQKLDGNAVFDIGLPTAGDLDLPGTPADGSHRPPSAPKTLVWVDRGAEVLVHLDSMSAQIADQCVLISIDLESDQTGRTPLVVAFALGSTTDAGLLAATDEYPRGNGLLASRWGSAVQTTMWSALLSRANEEAKKRGLAPHGLAISDGKLKLIAGEQLRIGSAS
jgi:hypothetical protein